MRSLKRHPGVPARFVLRLDGRELDVSGTDVVVGRSSDCSLRLEDGLVSRHHARLRETDGGLYVEDLGSRNGVTVNQQRITGPTRVAHGDVVGIGLKSIEIVDRHLLSRPETLSTMPPPSPRAMGFMSEDDATEETVTADLEQLSEREREVLTLIVHGHTQREIAERLHLSIKTVETHRAHLGEKLGCRTRAELISYAIAAGILRGK